MLVHTRSTHVLENGWLVEITASHKGIQANCNQNCLAWDWADMRNLAINEDTVIFYVLNLTRPNKAEAAELTAAIKMLFLNCQIKF